MNKGSQDALRNGIKALNLGLTDQQTAAMECFGELLLKWNATYNLTAITNEQDVVFLHLLDSLTFVHALDQQKFACSRLLDVGSGGGLPAIPFAICKPECHVTTVDAVKKKTLFLRQATFELGLKNVKVIHSRIQQVSESAFDIISSRAFASLPDMVSWTKHLLKSEGFWLAMKGKVPSEEISELPADIEVVQILPLTIPNCDFERNLIVLKRRTM